MTAYHTSGIRIIDLAIWVELLVVSPPLDVVLHFIIKRGIGCWLESVANARTDSQ